MDLGGGECPGDAVASMNPELIRQKGQSLPSHVTTLGACDRLPRCSLNRLRAGEQVRRHAGIEGDDIYRPGAAVIASTPRRDAGDPKLPSRPVGHLEEWVCPALREGGRRNHRSDGAPVIEKRAEPGRGVRAVSEGGECGAKQERARKARAGDQSFHLVDLLSWNGRHAGRTP